MPSVNMNLLSARNEADDISGSGQRSHPPMAVFILLAVLASITTTLILAFVIKRALHRKKLADIEAARWAPQDPRYKPPPTFLQQHLKTLRNWVKPETIKIEDVMLVNRRKSFVDMPLRHLWSPPRQPEVARIASENKAPELQRSSTDPVATLRAPRPSAADPPTLIAPERAATRGAGKPRVLVKDFARRKGGLS